MKPLMQRAKQSSLNEPRMTYRQLEKQNRLGKELLMRVTKQLTAAKDESRALLAQLKVANAILAILIQQHLLNNPSDAYGAITVSKELIQETLQTKTVSWKEAEDKALQLFVVEVANEDVKEGPATASDEGEGTSGASVENVEGTEAGEQVQEQEGDIERHNIPQSKRSEQVYTVVDATEIGEH
jgi:hypothetical protein